MGDCSHSCSDRFAGPRLFRAPRWVASGLILLSLTGCQAIGMDASVTPAAAPSEAQAANNPADMPSEPQYYPSDTPALLGKRYFDQGHYGLAQRYYQDAVEKSPQIVSDWVGLAASYDNLGRFDLADRAYASAIKLAGETSEILNNQGYSYLLRGNMALARKKLLAAARLQPGNMVIANNLHLLDIAAKNPELVKN